MEAAGTSNVLIYGGTGCKTYEQAQVNGKNQSRCTTLMILDDLWIFNVVKALSGQHPFSKLETSPKLPGLMGMAAATLHHADNRILLFGGSTVFHAETLLTRQRPAVVDEMFQMRDLQFRARKATSTHLGVLLELSACAKVQNSTHVVLFGGFVGNALSSGVFIYELAAAQVSLGFNAVPVLSQQAPAARGYAGLVKPDENTLIMFGGFSESTGYAYVYRVSAPREGEEGGGGERETSRGEG